VRVTLPNGNTKKIQVQDPKAQECLKICDAFH
jgi:hypothetical protein